MTGRPSLVVSGDDPTPPYEQLRRQVSELIGSGVIAAGERLPPVRQLAADLALAVGTVARAYRELEGAGLVRSSRGGGTRVVDRPALRSDLERRRLLREHATVFVRHALLLGAAPDEVLDAVSRELPGPEQRRAT